jgi:hypothetical protein
MSYANFTLGASFPGEIADTRAAGLIHAWHAARGQGLDAIPAGARKSLEHEFRHAVLAGLASVPRVPGPKNSTKQRPGRELKLPPDISLKGAVGHHLKASSLNVSLHVYTDDDRYEAVSEIAVTDPSPHNDWTVYVADNGAGRPGTPGHYSMI